jgi:hypothetical protein
MTVADATMGKFSITARLFKLVSDMSKDQHLLLLKQLMGDNVSTYLYKFIVKILDTESTATLHVQWKNRLEQPEGIWC